MSHTRCSFSLDLFAFSFISPFPFTIAECVRLGELFRVEAQFAFILGCWENESMRPGGSFVLLQLKVERERVCVEETNPELASVCNSPLSQ